jgi:hypothetical protein
MKWKWKWVAFAVAGVLLLVLAAVPLDYGFYNPAKGVAAAGQTQTAVDSHEREILQFTITETDVARFKGKVTLAALSDLYGTKDSLKCSVTRTYSNDNMAAASWPIDAGTPVTLCLN